MIDLCLLQVPVLPWTDAVADVYGPLAHKLRQLGRPIGAMDTLIAAQALAQGLVLVTHNIRHFEGVEGLRVEDWVAAKA